VPDNGSIEPFRAVLGRAFGGQERIVLLSALVLCGVPDKAELVQAAAADENRQVRNWGNGL